MTHPLRDGAPARRATQRERVLAVSDDWSAFAEPAVFFAGWIGSGLVMAWWMIRRGHAPRLTVAIGASLGPLMLIVAGESSRRIAEVTQRPITLRHPLDHGGDIDVVVVVPGPGEAVHEVAANLLAVGSRLRTCTVARVVDVDSSEDELRERHVSDLDLARCLLPVTHVGSELHRGTWQSVLPALREVDGQLVLLAGGLTHTGADR